MESWLLLYGTSWVAGLLCVALIELYRLRRSQPPRPWLNDVGAACLVWVLLPFAPLLAVVWLWARLRQPR
jgi:hypothetical protein